MTKLLVAYLVVALCVAISMRRGTAYRVYACLMWPWILITVIAKRADEEWETSKAWHEELMAQKQAPNPLHDPRIDK